MCLTIPGRIERIETPEPGVRQAVVTYPGARRTVSLLYLPEARVGEYVVVHAGFATTLLAESEALEALRYVAEMEALSRSGTADSQGPILRSARPGIPGGPE